VPDGLYLVDTQYKWEFLLRDMGTHGSPPTRVPEVPTKWTQPARRPTDLQVGPETLSTPPATQEDSRRPYPDPGGPAGLGAQDELLDRGLAPPVGPKITGFFLVIKADGLPDL
jgi:hypothetical protein